MTGWSLAASLVVHGALLAACFAGAVLAPMATPPQIRLKRGHAVADVTLVHAGSRSLLPPRETAPERPSPSPAAAVGAQVAQREPRVTPVEPELPEPPEPESRLPQPPPPETIVALPTEPPAVAPPAPEPPAGPSPEVAALLPPAEPAAPPETPAGLPEPAPQENAEPDPPAEPMHTERPKPDPVPAPRTESAPPRDSGVETGVTLVHMPSPHYPPSCRRRGIEGRTLVEARVTADGDPETVRVLESSGSDELDAAAVDAVRRARFDPATRDGRPVAASIVIPVRFQLR